MLTIWSPAGFQYSHSSSPGCARRTRVGSPQLRFTSAAFIPTRMVFWIMAWRNSLLVKERHSAATSVGIHANTNATATAYSLRLCMVVPPEQGWWAQDTVVGGCRAASRPEALSPWPVAARSAYAPSAATYAPFAPPHGEFGTHPPSQ